MPRIGVLALQGDFREHIRRLDRMGAETIEVRLPSELMHLDGLVLPGGESTVMGKLAVEHELLDPIKDLALRGFPLWGTCAGLILLAREVGRDQPRVAAMDVVVERNAFGRQVDSFEVDLDIPALEQAHRSFRGVFIRAPLISRVGAEVQVLARYQHPALKAERIVAARQGAMLATAFHPELTDDDRFHRYFLALIDEGPRHAACMSDCSGLRPAPERIG